MRATAPRLAALTGAAWALPAPAAHVPALCRALGISRRMAGAQPAARGEVALTFDDGPHPDGTPAVLRALDRAGARATFFLVGEQIRRDPALALEIVAAGHGVAVHGDRHRLVLRVGPRALRDDLDRCAALVEGVSGTANRHYRAPYGVFSPAALAEGRRRDWQPMLWSRWGADWRARATARSVCERVLRDAAAGDVVLLHDADHYGAAECWRATVAALPWILDGLAARGLRTVSL